MSNSAKLHLPDGQSIDLPVLTGSENEKAIDISNLRAKTGHITLDPGFVNTGPCESAITYLNGEKGILQYRGYPIEELAEHSTFIEVGYLLIHGELPNREQLEDYVDRISKHAMIHEDMKLFFEGFSKTAHPMVILSSMVSSLSAYYTEASGKASIENLEINSARLIAKISTIAAFSYKKSVGQPFVYPKEDLSYCPNFLNMMFSVPAESYKIDPDIVKSLELMLILHADHEQNCSASTVRVVGSSMANVYASVASGILALWGPLHGGANQQAVQMLQQIYEDGSNISKYIELAKNKKNKFRLMGFGHRVYKKGDSRVPTMEKYFKKISKIKNDKKFHKIHDIVKKVMIERKDIHPNVDFPTGPTYHLMGFDTDFFTPIFVLSRITGWSAHIMEQHAANKLIRPLSKYSGAKHRRVMLLNQR